MSIESIVKGLSEPVKKLIDACSKGVGTLYEPTKIRRIVKAIRENSDIPIKYSSEHITIDSTSFDELQLRAQNRVQYQEQRKQKNIENVISEAYGFLKDETVVSKEEVDEDWITRFFNIVGEISNEEMQMIWGKILAGEISKPKSYSLRTLDILRNISKSDAENFRYICTYIFDTGCDLIISKNDEILNSFNIKLVDIIKMTDIGLINPSHVLSIKLKICDVKNNSQFLIYGNKAILLENKNKGTRTISFPSYRLTNAGTELYKVIEKSYDLEFLNKIANELKKSDIRVFISEINSRNKGSIDCSEVEIEL